MPVTVEDAMKVVLPLIAGTVASYSAPASRAIAGAAGAYNAIDERKQRDLDAEQERQLRASEGDRRNRILDLQEKQFTADQDKSAQSAKDLGALFGSLISTHGGPATAPIEGTSTEPDVAVSGGLGVSEDQAQADADIANTARAGQAGVNDPRIVGAALNHLFNAPEARADMAQRFQQFQGTLKQRQDEAAATEKDRSANRDIQNRTLASEDAYRKGVIGAKDKEADTHAKGKAENGAADVSTESLTKKNKRIADLTEIAQARQLLPGEAAELKQLQVEVAHLTGANTGAAYLDSKLGLGRSAQ